MERGYLRSTDFMTTRKLLHDCDFFLDISYPFARLKLWILCRCGGIGRLNTKQDFLCVQNCFPIAGQLQN